MCSGADTGPHSKSDWETFQQPDYVPHSLAHPFPDVVSDQIAHQVTDTIPNRIPNTMANQSMHSWPIWHRWWHLPGLCCEHILKYVQLCELHPLPLGTVRCGWYAQVLYLWRRILPGSQIQVC
jgi:hypothetical protein